jgi:hypothetical protein
MMGWAGRVRFLWVVERRCSGVWGDWRFGVERWVGSLYSVVFGGA